MVNVKMVNCNKLTWKIWALKGDHDLSGVYLFSIPFFFL